VGSTIIVPFGITRDGRGEVHYAGWCPVCLDQRHERVVVGSAKEPVTVCALCGNSLRFEVEGAKKPKIEQR
jgi:hypothetical protein